MKLTPQQRIWARRIARELSAGGGTFMGVGLSLSLFYQRVDHWLVSLVAIGLVMSLSSFLLIPLYVEDLEDD